MRYLIDTNLWYATRRASETSLRALDLNRLLAIGLSAMR
jgi:predicted nucleic acid-binding protein